MANASDVRIVGVDLLLADLALSLSFQVLGLALELLAAVAGNAADGVANPPFDLVAKPFRLVLETLVGEIVRHDPFLQIGAAPRLHPGSDSLAQLLWSRSGQATCPMRLWKRASRRTCADISQDISYSLRYISAISRGGIHARCVHERPAQLRSRLRRRHARPPPRPLGIRGIHG